MERKVCHLLAHFSGRVQGVGFRYLTRRLAQGFEVNGRVENLADGRVELEAEGDEGEVRAFLKAVAEDLGDYIRETETRWDQRAARLSGFDITG